MKLKFINTIYNGKNMKHLAINWMTDVKDHILKTRKYCLEKLKNTLKNEELQYVHVSKNSVLLKYQLSPN